MMRIGRSPSADGTWNAIDDVLAHFTIGFSIVCYYETQFAIGLFRDNTIIRCINFS